MNNPRGANNISIGNRNQGVSLSSIKPMFPMENNNFNFKWKVYITPIMFNSDKALVGMEKQDES